MGAGIDQAVFFDIDRARKNVGRHITNHGHRTGIKIVAEFDTVDRLVGGVVQIRGIRRHTDFALLRHGRKTGLLARINGSHITVLNRAFRGLLAPIACNDVFGRIDRSEQIHRYHRELQGRTALQKQHAIVLRQAQQPPNPAFGISKDLAKKGRTVADLHHAHTRTADISKLGGGLLQHFGRHHRRPGRKVVNMLAHRYF